MKPLFNILIGCICLFFISCNADKPKENPIEQPEQETNVVKLTPAQVANAGITTGKAEYKTIATALQVNGAIEAPPQNLISVSVPLGGYVKKIAILQGMSVKKGTLLAELEDPAYIQLQQEYLTSQAQLGYLQKEFERQRDLNQSKATSDKVYQQTKADYQSQQAILKGLSEKLKLIGINPNQLTQSTLSRKLRLTSPIKGYITKININTGKYVQPTDILFELVDPSDLHLMLTIFEKDVPLLEIGQEVLAYRPDEPEKKYPAKIIYIGKDVENDRSVEVHCHLKTPVPDLLPGMFMNAEVETHKLKAYTLPNEAIVRFGEKQFVFIEKGQRIYEMQEVKTGNSEHGFTALEHSVDFNPTRNTYVLNGAYSLLMKLKNKEEE